MAVPPQGPWYSRGLWGYGYRPYGRYAGRPMAGCGCLYTVALVVLIVLVLSLFI